MTSGGEESRRSGDGSPPQSERFAFPAPIKDLPAWLDGNWQWFDPLHAHRVMWPDRPYRPDLDILVAGCGTNQAAVLAYTNPAARVVGIDINEAALNHHRTLKERYGLDNLDLCRIPVEQAAELGQTFDLIVCTGVLHHLSDPAGGLRALAGVLGPDGVAAVMVFARYGRAGVEMLQTTFERMGLGPDEESLEMVKSAIAALPSAHPLRGYLSIAGDLKVDAGLVETFLHGRDRSYTVAECLELTASAGLVFQDWFLRTAYYAPTLAEPGNAFYAALKNLPDAEQWAVRERFKTTNACHFFLACRPERPQAGYRVDFSGPGALDYVPVFRLRCGVRGDEVYRPGWSLRLDPAHLAFAELIDGQRSIGQITAAVADGGAVAHSDRSELDYLALELFEGLWRLDFVAVGV